MIECSRVSKWYGQVSALIDVSFHIDEGVIGLVGRNGAGKSTLMKLLSGLLVPTEGRVRIAGGDPTRPSTRRQLGYCPDIDIYYENLSGSRFVAWMLRLDGVPGRRARERSEEVLTRLGLEGAMRRPIRGYSKGMRQRVKLALALVHEPSAILLDEPMTGLDPVARHEMAVLIADLAKRGVTVLVSSHVLHELEGIAGRVLLVHQGRLVADGTVAQLRALLADRPYHLELRSTAPRELAEKLAVLELVTALRVGAESVEVETGGGAGLFESLSQLGASRPGLIDGIVPLDAGLEAVFGYLVDRRGGRR